MVSEGVLPYSAEQLIQALESGNICQRLKFNDLSSSSDNPSPQKSTSLPNAESSKKQTSGYTAFSVESLSLDDDPFQDPEPDDERPRSKIPFQRGSRRWVMNRCQLAAAAKQVFEERPRIFLFSVLLLENKARLFRWDLSGVVVTERFDWQVENSSLAEFFHRLDSASPEQCGMDPTVSLPTSKEISRAQAVFKRSGAGLRPEHTLHKFAVTDDVTGETRYLVAGNPLAGMAATSYVAVDLKDDSLVWLKDSWRHDIKIACKEVDVYRRLFEANVPHVSSMLVGGDVLGHQTENQNFVKCPWACWTEGVWAYTHYRVVLNTVARPLQDFKSTHELTTAVRDAIDAHAQAYTKLNILHADISARSIMITADGHGLLADWDLSFDVSQGEREMLSGTSQFTSAARLEHETKVHTLQDDLESFVHVFVYHLARYRPTSIREPQKTINEVYPPRFPVEEPWRGFDGKVSFFLQWGHFQGRPPSPFLSRSHSSSGGPAAHFLGSILYSGSAPCLRGKPAVRTRIARFVGQNFEFLQHASRNGWMAK
ncbi:hypothetical protein OF83DRAFT_1178583 [Amylostereum chailletii]|nr:hypothetical protein OF83DRAFT_1178583 [Amylostereum chailletii]